jgi:cholesterol transport system auxiliary component
MIRSTVRLILIAAALTVPLGGCVSLLPKTKPAQLYRFGEGLAAPASSTTASTANAFGVLKGPTGFVRSSAGDRILAVSPGGEATYIAEARWVSAAAVLFDEALERAFDADPGRARLISRGEVGKAELMLKLDVRAFEADYRSGAKSAPTARVEVRALITRNLDRTLVSDEVFTAQVRAGDNRVGPITQAFDKAVAQVLSQVVATVNAAAPAASNAPAAIAQPLAGGPPVAAGAPTAAPTTPIAPPVATAPAS